MTEAAAEPDPPPRVSDARRPRRLHPFSWLFVLVSRLRPFLLPAILLLFFGMGQSWELWGIAGAVVLALYALIYSFGFRYEIEDDGLVVREGVIFRTERHVPFTRVQSVVQRRNALHLMFGVTELRLESAGGTRPEAVMNVITVAEADRLERLLRGAVRAAKAEGATADAAESETESEDATETLFSLNAGEVTRLGLISNRGWIVVGVFLGLYWQLAPEDHALSKLVGAFAVEIFSVWGADPWTALQGVAWIIPAIVAFGLLLKPLSMVMTWLMFHGFVLTRSGARLSTTSGLLTRRSASARSDRIQRLVLRAPVLARMLGRRTLSCDVAVQRQEEGGDEMSRLHWLAPVGSPRRVDALIRELSPGMQLRDRQWRPLHEDAWKRELKGWVIAALIASAVLFWPLRHLVVVPAIAILVWGWFHARGWAKFAAWSHDGDSLAYRAGWLVREWTTALLGNGHVVRLTESPFDRRRGMAGVQLDTQGAGQMQFPLKVPYLPVETARALHAEIAERMAEVGNGVHGD